jgi:hypothetical protein
VETHPSNVLKGDKLWRKTPVDAKEAVVDERGDR